MDKAKWYVLQTALGCELSVMHELRRRGVSAIVPIECRVIRSKGKWISKDYIVFPGYVFINVKYGWSQYYIMSGISGVVRLLGGGYDPEPLTDSEAELLVRQAEIFRTPSILRLTDGGGYEFVSGALSELKDTVKSINRHSHRAIAEMQIAGKKVVFELSFVIENTKADEASG